ncbi:DgyrCDS315 [Dimorphilus gyrociliatus]|uniref:Ubiquitin-protein ligase E3B n=1 Tax=Dimorphilus gyrociliatus TaxID=2664684 RepID=A0A7I8V5Q0_9ANNE|nr:DgyrCDS315 [Dimorphilus gyrociliatus]
MLTDDPEKKNEFLNAAKSAREERAAKKLQEDAAIRIQSFVRGSLSRKKTYSTLRDEIDSYLKVRQGSLDYNPSQFGSALSTYNHLSKLLFVFKQEKDLFRFQCFCKYLLASILQSTLKVNYIPLAMPKTHFVLWIEQAKKVLLKCCQITEILKPDVAKELCAITVFINTIFSFTSTSTWKVFKDNENAQLKSSIDKICSNILAYLYDKGLFLSLQIVLKRACSRSKPFFNNALLSVCVTIGLRRVQLTNDESTASQFLLRFVSTPALFFHLKAGSEKIFNQIKTLNLLDSMVEILKNDQSRKIVFYSLDENYKLCLLANLVDIALYSNDFLGTRAESIAKIVIDILQQCGKYTQNKKSNLCNWHPILGWFSQSVDQSIQEAMPLVNIQLQQLWKASAIKQFFELLLLTDHAQIGCVSPNRQGSQSKETKNIFQKIREKANKVSSSNIAGLKLESPLCKLCRIVCQMYQTALLALSQLKLDILSSLSNNNNPDLITKLWCVVLTPGVNPAAKAYTDLMSMSRCGDEFSILLLACEVSSHLMIILDDGELYERQTPFTLDLLGSISDFLNQLCFKLIWSGNIKVGEAEESDLFKSLHSLLMLIYERNCRRAFVSDEHWLIKDVKPSHILSEMEKGDKKREANFLLQKVPHIIPHKDRVVLFRKFIQANKSSLNITNSLSSPRPTIITVHRSHLVEDGYRQLAEISPKDLKGVIRVKFVNEQGLDEAGIDQDGVFKEFLEETISRIFDPSLNLFKTTDEQKLYPSPTSFVQDDHLQLFNFVGKMLAKAVYEGIVVELPFAPFFLSQLLGKKHSNIYSPIDELPSLDAELYKNLTFIKHYEGNVADLDLTFSCTQDVLGKLQSFDLTPGGSALNVTNENKIRYIHLMANFRMRTQIKHQTAAFLQGFKSIVNSEWLSLFSARELQKLISGDTVDIDLDDLRQHTHYYGGFHNNHKVVSWLWDILNKDFNAQERALFLKFVTSCSKPPLLGFANLEPPFSIRCVEVSDDQDNGDTVGSVIKGFFNVRKKETMSRLPTSSTCFNLLKLPNYQKKSTLREKLRYAITSNTGFELS